MAIDSGASVNVIDEKSSPEKLYIEITKVKLYGYAKETPIPVAGKFKAVIGTGNEVAMATSLVVKGRTDGEILRGCDTAMLDC